MVKRFFRLLCSILIASFVFSCNPTDSKTTETFPVAEDYSETDISGFYKYQNNGDTVELQLAVDSNVVNGSLVFALKEKDKNTGTIKGHFANGVLMADYTFMSEGITSVRQVAFKLDNNKAIALHGEMEESAGKLVYKNPDNLKADELLILMKQ